MSKLDDILFNPVVIPDDMKKQQIKDFMLDLIDNTGVYRSEIGHWTVDSETLKKKVEEL